MSRKPKLFFVEGNIGSGKSTALKALEAMGFAVLYEPIDVWKEKYRDDDSTLFDNFYLDKSKWSFAMQIGVMTSRLNTLIDLLKKNEHETVVVERSIFTDRHVFATNLWMMNSLNEIEYTILKDTFALFLSMLRLHAPEELCHHIYLRTDSDVCFSRKEQRNRSAESAAGVPLGYLNQLEHFHSTWLFCEAMDGKVSVVDGNLDEQKVVEQMLAVLNK